MSVANKIALFLNTLFLFALTLSYCSPYIDPSSFLWPMAFIGLFYPVLYFVNFLFMIYWIVSLKKYFLSNFIILLIGYGSLNNFIQLKQQSNQETKHKVMSFNVRIFNKYNWIKDQDVKKNILTFINKESPSILCLQEFYAPDVLPDINLPYQHIGLQNERKKWRMATYSSFPMIKKGTVSIEGENINNVCIFSDLLINNDTIRVYNIHLASNTFDYEDYAFLEEPSIDGAENIARRLKNSFIRRAQQVKAIRKHIDQAPFPVMICGDFNDTPNSFAYRVLSNGLNDAFTSYGQGLGTTYRGPIPNLRIDYILYDPSIAIQSFKEEKVNLSDHNPIIASF